jgi:Vitamin-D-receptor interacting Mediator subunit 4
MDKLVATPLDALEASLGTLLASLTTTPTFSTAPTASTALLTADDALTSSLTTLKKHQQNYARILHLRAEATRLEEQIKSIVRTCGELRSEIGAIHPSILDDSSEDEEEEGRQQDVDYNTLLSFARRIGKYNTRAAREAEEDSIRRRQDAKERVTAASLPAANGNVPPVSMETTPEVGNIIPDNERAWLNETAVAARAAQGMAFPAAERLRLGMLGQLQYAREQGGEEAVERELVRLSGGNLDRETDAQATNEPEAMRIYETETQRHAQAPTNAYITNARLQRPPERKKSVAPLNLDLWNEDEDED